MIQYFKDFIESIFGTYQPILIDDNGTIIDYSPDWGYIIAGVIFCIFLYSMLKTIGGIIYEWCRK